MHQYWSFFCMLNFDPPEIVEDGSSILWYTMVGPGGEVILDYLTRATTLSRILCCCVAHTKQIVIFDSLYIITHHQLKLPDGVVCKGVLFHNGNIEWAIVLATPTFRPVLLTFLGPAFLNVGYHDNSPDLLLPHHLPEVSDSVRKGTWKMLLFIYGYMSTDSKKVPCEAMYLFA